MGGEKKREEEKRRAEKRGERREERREERIKWGRDERRQKENRIE